MKTNLLMDTRRNSLWQDFSSYSAELPQRPHTRPRLRIRALPLTTGSVPLSMHSSNWVSEEHMLTVRQFPTGQLLPLGLHSCFLSPGLSGLVSMDSGSLLPAEYQPSFKRKRRYVSSSSQSSESATTYAGAKFEDPPSPKQLPLPPLHWRVGFGVSCQSSDNRRYCMEMTNAIKSLLQI